MSDSERIGAYRIEGRLGRGGMGEVFLAWDDRLRRRVAIKRIRHDLSGTPAFRERFLREARAAAGLSHPAIVQVYDLVEDSTGDSIVMEYVEGRTLAERLDVHPLKPAEAVRLAREIAEGLAAAHEAGFVHRDLKAENILVTPAGHAKILDFGLARALAGPTGEAGLTQNGILVGTYHAMSPEQARGGDVDARSDLFSLGALIHEMLTSVPPFKGVDPPDTLRRVTIGRLPALRAVRPGVPAKLDALVDRLLAKDRESRPRDAAEVARALREVERGLEPDSAEAAIPLGETMSDQPTASVVATPATAKMPVYPARKRLPAPAFLAVLAVIAGIALGSTVLLKLRRDEPLRVAVARPEVDPDGGEPLRLAASGLLVATLGGLASLEGLAPIDPREASRGGRSPVEMARTAAASEVLLSTVEAQGPMARVALSRVQGSDGRVLWTETFDVPTDPAGLRLLSDAVAVSLHRAYPDHRLRPGTPELGVRDEDYAAFLGVRQRFNEGQMDLETELERLEAALRGSPRFLEARLLAARTCFSLFESTREVRYLDRAAALVGQARELAPEDPRPLKESFRIALAAGRHDEAEASLAALGRVLPGDPDLLALRAELAESQGRMDEALAALRTAAQRAPSWQNLYRLAGIEARSGRIAEARGHLEAILKEAPDNAWAREELARIEMLFGDPQRAEGLFQDLLRDKPQRYLFTNLGLTRFLLGRYGQAAAAYREALKLDPEHVIVSVNLADAEAALGHREEALALYRRVLARLGEKEAGSPLAADEGILKARCLIALGRAREAAGTVREALRQSPDDPEILFWASGVYVLTGDRASGLSTARASLARGMQPRWFAVPAFRPLRGDPEFLALLPPGDLPWG